ncbi:MAG: sigma-54 interaction domain-containing protein [Desulfitobacteriaceae bacterium]
MEQTKRIIIIALGRATLESILAQLEEIFSGQFNFEGYVLSELSLQAKNLDTECLILFSTPQVKDLARPYLPPGVNTLIAERAINYRNLKEILTLPKGIHVLLVSNNSNSAQETVDQLIASGISQVEFIPFYPGVLLTEHPSVAVTPGELALVPTDIEKVIDIGCRPAGLTTILEILEHFRMDSSYRSMVLIRYMQSIMELVNQLKDEISAVNLYQSRLEAIVRNSDDGILVFDREKRIQVVNMKAGALLGLSEFAIRGKTIAELSIPVLQELFAIPEGDVPHFLDHANGLFVKKIRVESQNSDFGWAVLFRKAEEIQKLEHDYRKQVRKKGRVAKYTFKDIISASAAMTQSLTIAKNVSASSSNVLLLGETGTGKEMMAQAIHNQSLRRQGPFIGVNLASITESLLESELFGYVEGAFTGARKGGHQGLFEQAHGGTIFLDEIGDASLAIQNRLLRVLQEREVMRVGGDEVIPVDVRVIAATNRNLEEMIRQGIFRADLYYRLKVLVIRVPPLRERIADLDRLLAYFLNKYGKGQLNMSHTAMEILRTYSWPGNVRELENMVEYLVHIEDHEVLPQHLPIMELANQLDLAKPTIISSSMDKKVDDVLEKIKKQGFSGDCHSVLQAYAYLCSNNSAGRRKIQETLVGRGVFLSEQQLRHRMNLLAQLGLLTIRGGRSGSCLTQLGEATAGHLKAEENRVNRTH